MVTMSITIICKIILTTMYKKKKFLKERKKIIWLFNLKQIYIELVKGLGLRLSITTNCAVLVYRAIILS